MQTERLDTVLAAERLGKQVSSPEGVLAILADVSIAIARGETVGVVGRNGSGKSTLLKMICGTLSPTEGEIHTAGRIAPILSIGTGFNGGTIYPMPLRAENGFLPDLKAIPDEIAKLLSEGAVE